MMRTKNTIFLSFFVLLLGLGTPYAAHGQEKADTWFSSLLEAVKPRQKSENDERLQRVIHNINKHEEEVARLRILGYDEFSILQHFKAQQPALGSGSISGRVRLKGEGPSWSPTIYVRAYNEYGFYAGGAYIGSSDNGKYSITGLLPGKYYLRARAYGYETAFYRKTSDWTKAKLINVQDRKNTGGKNFVLRSNKGKGSISGQIKGQDGASLSECFITAYGGDYDYIGSFSTDEIGMYEIEGLTGGTYRLRCNYYGSRSFISEWYDDEQSYESATEVKVTEPKATTGINFVLDFGGIIKGKVTCASGKKAGSHQCWIFAYDKKKNLVESGITDEKGKFTVTHLKKGKYKLFASYRGPENSLNGWYKGAEDFKHAKKIQVNPHKTKSVQIKLKPGGAISGKVVDYSGQPLPNNCYINIYDESHAYVAYARTDANGDYSVMRIPTGRYKLFAKYNDYSSSVGSQPIDEWYDGKYIFKDATLVQVYAPQTTPNINFSLDQGGSISGRVEIPDEYPNYLDECWVRAYDKQGFVGSSEVMYNRQFFISGLRSGEYRLLIDHEDYAAEWYDRKQNIGLADTIRVTAPNTTQGINFTLEYPGIMQGFLTDNKGNRLPSEDYLIFLYAYNTATGEYESTGANSFTGGYQVRLLSGNYKLAAVSVYFNWQPEHDGLVATFYPNGQSFYDPSNESVNLTENSVRKLNTLVMKKTSGAISGTLFDESTGLPLEDEASILFAYDEDGYLVKVSVYGSDPITGEYKLMGLRPGNYYVVAAVWEWATNEITFLWYGSTSSGTTYYDIISPKVEIPANAYAVIVGEGETKEIDFYIKR